jgi:hypothetical protein
MFDLITLDEVVFLDGESNSLSDMGEFSVNIFLSGVGQKP